MRSVDEATWSPGPRASRQNAAVGSGHRRAMMEVRFRCMRPVSITELDDATFGFD
jgi:hypothetical protein